MSKIRTSVLLALAMLAFLLGGMLMDGGASLRPVKDSTGAVVYQRPGRILMEADHWKDIRRNWVAFLSWLLAAVLILWCVIRWISDFFRRLNAT